MLAEYISTKRDLGYFVTTSSGEKNYEEIKAQSLQGVTTTKECKQKALRTLFDLLGDVENMTLILNGEVIIFLKGI